MYDIDQENSYLDQCMEDYYEKKMKKHNKGNKNIPDEIEIFSVNDLN